MTTTAPAGAPIPAGLSSKAKFVANLIVSAVGILTSAAALALIPDDVVPDATVLAVGAVLTLVANAVSTLQTSNKLTAPIEVVGDIPGKHAAP